jgi:hypothetical protein
MWNTESLKWHKTGSVRHVEAYSIMEYQHVKHATVIISKNKYYLSGCNTMLSGRSSLSYVAEDAALHNYCCKKLKSIISNDTAQYAIKIKYTVFLYICVFHDDMENGGSRL